MKNTCAFTVATIILILISTFFISATVVSQCRENVSERELYYQELEQDYVKEIRSYLHTQGYENSGVTLTRTVDEQGNREYKVALHHKYLEKLPLNERENIFRVIEDMAFEEEGCIFFVNLLI